MGVRSKIKKGSIGPGTEKVDIKTPLEKYSTKDHPTKVTTIKKKRTIEDEYTSVEDPRFTEG
jgi:hypothetical protein